MHSSSGSAKYIWVCKQTFKNPRPALQAALAESGMAGMENGIKKKDESAKKKKKVDKGVRACPFFNSQNSKKVLIIEGAGRYGKVSRQPSATR